MRRPAATGSARERDGRTRRAGAGRADAGQKSSKDTADDGSSDSKGSSERPRREGAGRGERLPAQPGRADRETRRSAGEASAVDRDGAGTGRGRTADERTDAADERTSASGRRTGAVDRRTDGKRTGTARTDGRGRRLGAGGVGAIPGSSGGTRPPRAPGRRAGEKDIATDEPGRDETRPDETRRDEPGRDESGHTDSGRTGNPGTTTGTADATDTAAGSEEKGDGADRPARPARPRPVRPAPHIVRRRRVALLVVVLVLLGGLAGGVAFLLYGSGLADVETVTVDGALAVPQDQVLAAAAIPTGGPLAGVDASGAEQRVAALPGVASVTVGRDWPHTVVVTVVERVAVALADTPKGLMLVDGTGVPYEQAPEVPPVLPHLNVSITGSVEPGDVQTTAGLGVLAALPDAVRSQVLTITVIAPAATGGLPTVELVLSDDRRVVWGSAENSQRKAAVLTALLTEKGSVFDVASPDLPTIRR